MRKNIAFNLILGLNVFILFFLLFEGRIVVPPFLQVIGRMHPLLLHFPIVLLILALLFDLFERHLFDPEQTGRHPLAGGQAHARNPEQTGGHQLANGQEQIRTPEQTAQRRPGAGPSGKNLVTILLYAGALSAALTVVMGLLLSKEEGYSGATLNWHKWTGITISLFSALLLWYRGGRAMRPRMLRAGLILTCVVLVLAGHLGASLTHGEGFVLQPVKRSEEKQVDLATAVVFPDLVLPILEDKCFSCHNSNKAKGELILTDTAGLLAGGEDGALYKPGDPAGSLLMERLLLDLEHEHHMPPKDKPQLTEPEIALISAWIGAGADFNLPLAALPPTDTIQALAKLIYNTAPATEEYNFAAADPGTIQELNTAYRVIAPEAEGSPALDASFFNSNAFNEESLAALKPLTEQIVQLNLSGMPLKDNDYKLLSTFTNLRQLNLNYTPLTDKELPAITRLPNLKSLMLTGTEVTPEGLDSVVAMPSLRHLYVWNTEVDSQKAAAWTDRRPGLVVETGFYDNGSTVLPLTKPKMEPSTAFFKEAFNLQFSHPISGTELHYTTDGTEPDSLQAPLYEAPMTINENTLVKLKAFKEGWTGSETITTHFYKAGYRPDSVELQPAPNPDFKARGTVSLFDLVNGSTDIRDGKWLGYLGNPFEALLRFREPLSINELALSVFSDTRAQIFPPASVEVWGGPNPDELELLGEISPSMPGEHQPAAAEIYACPLAQRQVSCLKVVVRPMEQLPSWHDAAGQPVWIFVDEILLN